MPNYRKIDRDPRWHRWLASLDPLLGCPRQQLLNQAVASGDASRISAFFRGFLSEAGGAQASSAPPRRATRSSDGPIYTRAQIAKLYEISIAAVPTLAVKPNGSGKTLISSPLVGKGGSSVGSM